MITILDIYCPPTLVKNNTQLEVTHNFTVGSHITQSNFKSIVYKTELHVQAKKHTGLSDLKYINFIIFSFHSSFIASGGFSTYLDMF